MILCLYSWGRTSPFDSASGIGSHLLALNPHPIFYGNAYGFLLSPKSSSLLWSCWHLDFFIVEGVVFFLEFWGGRLVLRWCGNADTYSFFVFCCFWDGQFRPQSSSSQFHRFPFRKSFPSSYFMPVAFLVWVFDGSPDFIVFDWNLSQFVVWFWCFRGWGWAAICTRSFFWGRMSIRFIYSSY